MKQLRYYPMNDEILAIERAALNPYDYGRRI